jgi:MFS transporter, DHA2 family, multidrug resistance protein
MILVAPQSAKLVETRGARFTLLIGYASLFLAFASMLLRAEGSPYWQVGVAYTLIGIGVGLLAHRRHIPSRGRSQCGAPGWPPAPPICSVTWAVRSCSPSSVRCSRRDTPRQSRQRFAASPNAEQVTTSVQSQLTKLFSSAAAIAERYPQYSAQIIAGARSSFLSGADWAYTAGIIAIVVGGAIVFFLLPKREQELQLLATYRAEDTNRPTATRGRSSRRHKWRTKTVSTVPVV